MRNFICLLTIALFCSLFLIQVRDQYGIDVEENFECFADNPLECSNRIAEPASSGCESWKSCYDVCVLELGGKHCYEKCNIDFLGSPECGCDVCSASSGLYCYCVDF